MKKVDVAVVGGGVTGLLSAYLCARAGLSVGLFAPEVRFPEPKDSRTTALMMPAIQMFENLELFSRLEGISAPLEKLRLIDRTSKAGKQPDICFQAEEVGEVAFGRNFLLADLDALFRDLLQAQENVLFDRSFLTEATYNQGVWTLSSEGGAGVIADCVIAADGGKSLLRQAVSIQAKRWSYHQVALIGAFDHTASHDCISTEFHYDCGPTVLVPLPGGHKSSFVHVVRPDQVEALEGQTAEETAAYFSEKTENLLGEISPFSFSGKFPLSGMVATSFAKRGVFLVGEAAHQIPPIGAQGLNMGLRDAALACEIILAQARIGGALSDNSLTEAYNYRRRGDVVTRLFAVDLLSKSLTSSLSPLLFMRRKGLSVLEKTGLFRRLLMQAGMQPLLNLPEIMKKEAA